MPIWDGAQVLLLERSSAGQTATVLGAGDAVLASCDDGGNVVGPDGAALMTATLSTEPGAHSDMVGADLKRLRARVEVTGADGTAAGSLGVKSFTVTPFSKKITIAMLDPAGAEVGDLATVDRKGRELALTYGGANVATLALADRDSGIRRTVERWSLEVGTRPPPPGDLLAAAAILRKGKLQAEVSSPG